MIEASLPPANQILKWIRKMVFPGIMTVHFMIASGSATSLILTTRLCNLLGVLILQRLILGK